MKSNSERKPNRKLDTYAEIGLTHGQIALVSLDDYDRLLFMGTWFTLCGIQFRAVRKEGKTNVYMHHDVLETTGEILRISGKEVDHINRNPLDNRRDNLRITDRFGNMRNTERHKNHVGVMFHNHSGRWLAYLNYPKKVVSLGYWSTREKALQVVAMARPIEAVCATKEEFLKEWEKVKPRKAWVREGI